MNERMSQPVLSIDTVAKHFGKSIAVDGISLDIRENEFFALLGPSGCGKTTLLRMIAGFEMPDSGVIRLDGTRHHTAAAGKAAAQPDVPVLCAVSAYDRAAEPRLRSGNGRPAARPRSRRGSMTC